MGRGTRGSGVMRYPTGRGVILQVVTLLKMDAGGTVNLIAMDSELVLGSSSLIYPSRGLS